jgi:hypothetical protein
VEVIRGKGPHMRWQGLGDQRGRIWRNKSTLLITTPDYISTPHSGQRISLAGLPGRQKKHYPPPACPPDMRNVFVLVHRSWYLVSTYTTWEGTGPNHMPRGLKVSRVLIANMILFVNTHKFFNHKLFALGHLM